MTTKKRETSKRGTKKLKLKKETIKDLSPPKGKVRGGYIQRVQSNWLSCPFTMCCNPQTL